MRAIRALSLVILAALLAAQIAAAEEAGCVIDPVPYEKLLAETVEKVVAQDWGRALDLVRVAESADICNPGLASLHRAVYLHIVQLSELLQRSAEIEEKFSIGDTEGLRENASEVYNALDSLKQVLYDSISLYISQLSKYAQDKVSFYEYARRLSRDVDALKGVVSIVMERLANIYTVLGEEAGGMWLEISVSLPRRIYAGDNATLAVTVSPAPTNVTESENREVRMNASLIIGNLIEVRKTLLTRLGENVTLTMQVSDVRELADAGIEFMKITSFIYAASAKAVFEAEVPGTGVRGFTIRPVYIYAVSPPLKFYVPSYADTNSTLTIVTVSAAMIPINVSIYLDKVSNETLITNATVPPGTTELNVSLSNVPSGYHTVIVISEPIGRYVSGRWSSAIVVGSPNVPVIMNVPKVVLVPPFIISVTGELGSGGEYEVVIYVDGIEAYRSLITDREFSAILSIPIGVSTLLIGRSVIRVEVVPRTPGYDRSVYVVDVIVINVLTTLLLISITGSLYLHPRTASVFAALIRSALTGRADASTKASANIRKRRSFRPFKLRKYYIEAIGLLSRVAGHPSPSDTLREYFRKVASFITPGLREVVERLFRLFELDLYSKHEVGSEEARKLLTDIKEGLSEAVEEQ